MKGQTDGQPCANRYSSVVSLGPDPTGRGFTARRNVSVRMFSPMNQAGLGFSFGSPPQMGNRICCPQSGVGFGCLQDAKGAAPHKMVDHAGLSGTLPCCGTWECGVTLPGMCGDIIRWCNPYAQNSNLVHNIMDISGHLAPECCTFCSPVILTLFTAPPCGPKPFSFGRQTHARLHSLHM